MDCMRPDELAPPEKTADLRQALNQHHRTTQFNRCRTMGDVVRLNLQLMLGRPRPE